eukprot:360223-Rhodomonas_salina.1
MAGLKTKRRWAGHRRRGDRGDKVRYRIVRGWGGETRSSRVSGSGVTAAACIAATTPRAP